MTRQKPRWQPLDMTTIPGANSRDPAPSGKKAPAEPDRAPVGFFAKIVCIGDVVEVFATVDFLHAVGVKKEKADVLNVIAVVELEINGGSRVRGMVVANSRRALPSDMRDDKQFSSCEFSAPGSPCVLHAVDLCSLRIVRRVDVHCIQDAIRCAADAVGVRIAYPQEMASFADTVNSRVLMLTREDALAKHKAAQPVASKHAVQPFIKPDFKSVEDLLYSFATHALDQDRKEYALPATGDETVPRSALRSLVFCHPLLAA